MQVQIGKLSNSHLLGIIIVFFLAVLLSFEVGVRVGRMRKGISSTKPALKDTVTPPAETPATPVEAPQERVEETVEESPKPPPSPQEEGYTIQLGAFISSERASRLAEELKGKGYEARVKYRNDFHRVFVGYFNTRSEAREYAERMKDNLGFEMYVITKP
jgi:cell division septation protein DedD